MAFRCPCVAPPPCVNIGGSLLDGLIGAVIVAAYPSVVATTTRAVVHPPHRPFQLGDVILPRIRNSPPPMLSFLARASGSLYAISALMGTN